MKFKILLALSLLSPVGSCFGEQIVLGAVSRDAWPVKDGSGNIVKLNVNTFGGGLQYGAGSVCGGLWYCYSYDGSGNWQFDIKGTSYCTNTCTYTPIGNLVQTITPLGQGVYTVLLGAALKGTFIDDKGHKFENVIGYFNSFTNPAVDGVTVVAGGGLTIVLPAGSSI